MIHWSIALAIAAGFLACLWREKRQKKQLAEALQQERHRSEQLTRELALEKSHSEEKLQLLQKTEEALSHSMKAASQEALEQSQKIFLQLAETTLAKVQQQSAFEMEKKQSALGELVQPIHKGLAQMESKIHELEKARIGAYAGLIEQLQSVSVTQHRLREETTNLVKALRQPHVRGRWGEMQLQRVVEMAGMVEHCDFELQSSLQREEGVIRPDMIVHLPGGQCLVVDAKTPLQAYLEAIEAEDEETQKAKLKDHARQLRTQVDLLSKKSYWSGLAKTPEFVVLFLPGEPFFSAALQYDTALLERSLEQRVVIATPMTLISLLRSISYGWRQEKIAQNAEEICSIGRQLCERMPVFYDHFATIKRGLEQAVRSYNGAVSSFESRLSVSARRLSELGVQACQPLVPLEEVELRCRDLVMPLHLDETEERLAEEGVSLPEKKKRKLSKKERRLSSCPPSEGLTPDSELVSFVPLS